jgi:hypothetical protein
MVAGLELRLAGAGFVGLGGIALPFSPVGPGSKYRLELRSELLQKSFEVLHGAA